MILFLAELNNKVNVRLFKKDHYKESYDIKHSGK